MTMSRMASLYGLDTDAGVIGDGAGPTYGTWDAEILYACVCDVGFTGPDCSQGGWLWGVGQAPEHQRVVVRASLTHSVVTHSEMCPKGDDPATTGQQDRVIKLTTGNSAASNLGGDWVFRFNGQDSTTVSSNANTATCTVMEAAWESMANIEVCHPRFLPPSLHPHLVPHQQNVRCFRSTPDVNTLGAVYILAIEFAKYGQSNLFEHDGNAPISLFTCDGSDVVANTGSGTPSCAFTDDVDLTVLLCRHKPQTQAHHTSPRNPFPPPPLPHSNRCQWQATTTPAAM